MTQARFRGAVCPEPQSWLGRRLRSHSKRPEALPGGPAALASPTGPVPEVSAARLPPRDSAPSPGTTGLLPPAHRARLLPRSVQALPPHLPRMQGAGAPRRRGPYSREIGALGRPGVILLTYALVTLGLTCLFMRFSIMPVSARPQQPGRQHGRTVPLGFHPRNGGAPGVGPALPEPPTTRS